MMKCPICDGEGEFREYIDYWLANRYDCPYCEGKGSISIFKWLKFLFWEHAPVWFVEAYGELRYKIYVWLNHDDGEDA
jgi:hypothetical protein